MGDTGHAGWPRALLLGLAPSQPCLRPWIFPYFAQFPENIGKIVVFAIML